MDKKKRFRPYQVNSARRAGRSTVILGGTHVNNHGTMIQNQIGAATVDSDPNRSSNARQRLFPSCAVDAIHSSEAVASQDMCLEGTRKPTLSALSNHLLSTDPGSCDVLWFNGPAGGGKSAVMRSLANTLPQISSFFFFRADHRRNTIRGFIPTIAYQMAQLVPQASPFILSAIEEDPAVFSQSTKLQAQRLLELPFIEASKHTSGSTSTPISMSILVDGLDECDDHAKQVELIDALVSFADAVRHQTTTRVKVIIASRPEYSISNRLKPLVSDNAVATLTLDRSDAELELYYDTELAKIRKTHFLPITWPTPSQKRELLDKTSGQYAFASTAMRVTAKGDPEHILEMVLGAVSDDNENPLDSLDQLYAFVFSQIPRSMLQRALEVVASLLGPTWTLRTRLSLTTFLSLPDNFIDRLSLYISSLFTFDDKIEPYHATLADFLFNRSRSEKYNLFISQPESTLAFLGHLGRLIQTSPRPLSQWQALSEAPDPGIGPGRVAPSATGKALSAFAANILTKRLDLWGTLCMRWAVYRCDRTRVDPALQDDWVRRTEAYTNRGFGRLFGLHFVYLARFSLDDEDSEVHFEISKAFARRSANRVSGFLEADQEGWNILDPCPWFISESQVGEKRATGQSSSSWFLPALRFTLWNPDTTHCDLYTLILDAVREIAHDDWLLSNVDAVDTLHSIGKCGHGLGWSSCLQFAACANCMDILDRFRAQALTDLLLSLFTFWLEMSDGDRSRGRQRSWFVLSNTFLTRIREEICSLAPKSKGFWNDSRRLASLVNLPRASNALEGSVARDPIYSQMKQRRDYLRSLTPGEVSQSNEDVLELSDSD